MMARWAAREAPRAPRGEDPGSTAKPRFVGSIPAGASKSDKELGLVIARAPATETRPAAAG
jgi:hypothetical protein